MRLHARRSSSSSTLSRNTAKQEIGSEIVISTAETTSMDASSVSKDDPKDHRKVTSVGRVLRARRSLIESYNESILSGTARRHANTPGGNRTLSGETLVDDTSTAATPADNINQLASEQLSVKGDLESGQAEKMVPSHRMSTRLGKLAKAKDEVKQALTGLGRRGRNAMSLGKRATIDVAKGLQRRASLRPRLGKEETKKNDEPVSKKATLPDTGAASKDSSTVSVSQAMPPKPKVKRWLSHGLYFGQHRSFDGRLTESQNRLKAAASENSDQKENSILPLPMFTGARLLEIGRDFKLPYDIFSPLPPGQPKPEEWQKTQKSKLRLHKIILVYPKIKAISLIIWNRCLRW